MTPFVAGLLTLGLPLALLGLLFLRRTMPVLVFYFVALAVGLGYLTTTGAVEDIGAMAIDRAGLAEAAKSPEPAVAN
ncbi:MAG: hypothetical protein ACT4N2_06205 [Hyphomicrobium sp.]